MLLSRLSLKTPVRTPYRKPRSTPLSPYGLRDWLLEDRCLMNSDPLVPTGSTTALSNIFWHGGTPLNDQSPFQNVAAPPVKTITIQNNSTDLTIYPFLRDANTGQREDDNVKRPYDPQDNNGGPDSKNPGELKGEEFRAYIGYHDTATNSNRIGLLPGASITIQVPLVFWDGANIYFATESKDLFNTTATATPVITGGKLTGVNISSGGGRYTTLPNVTFKNIPNGAAVPIVTPVLTDGKITSFTINNAGNLLNSGVTMEIDPPPNPFTYSETSTRGVWQQGDAPDRGAQWVVSYTSKENSQTSTGLVMFYNDQTAKTPSPDAPAQLTEYTIRDPYLRNFDIPDKSGQTLVIYNYDVSYVDSQIAPIAMQATHVPVPVLPNLARGQVQVGGGAVTGITVAPIEAGSGYTSPPIVTISKPQTGNDQATAVAMIDGSGKVTGVQITHGGGGYTSAIVNFSFPPGPTPAPDYGWVGAKEDFAALQSALSAFINNEGTASVGKYFGDSATPPGWPSYYSLPGGDLKIPSGANVFANSPLDGKRSSFDQNRWLLTSGGPGPVAAAGNGKVASAAATSILMNFDTQALRDKFVKNLQDLLATNQEIRVSVDPNPPIAGVKVNAVANGNVATQAVVTVNTGTGLEPDPKSYSLVFAPVVSDYASTAITNLWYGWAQYYLNTFSGFTPIKLTGGVKAFNKPDNGPKEPGNVLTLTQAPPPGVLKLGMTVSGLGIVPASGPQYDTLPGSTTQVTILGMDDYENPTKIYLSQQVTQNTSGEEYTFGKPVELPSYLNDTNPVTGEKWTTPLNIVFSGQTAQEAKETLLFAASVYEAIYVESTIPKGDLFKSTKLPKAMEVIGTVIGFNAKDIPNSRPTEGDIGGQLRDVVKSILRGVYDFQKKNDEALWYPDPKTETANQKFNVFNLDPYVWFVHRVLGLSGYGFSVDDDAADVGAGGFPLPQTGVLPNNLTITYSGLAGLNNQNEWFPSVPWGEITGQARIYQGTDPTTGLPASIIQFEDPVKFSMVKADAPKEGFVGAYVSGPAGLPKNLRLKGPGPGGEIQKTYVLSETVASMDFTTFKFTGKPVHDNAVKDGSFESPVVSGDPKFRNDPTGTSWTWGNTQQGPNNEGIAANGNPFTSQLAPEGTQVAYIQRKGSISQTVTIPSGGTYALTFFAAQRPFNQQSLQLYVNGVAIGDPIKPIDANYLTYTTAAFPLHTGNNVIMLKGTSDTDNTALIDVVRLVEVNNLIQNAGFEAPALAANQSIPDPPGNGWVWSNSLNEGVAHNGSGYTAGNPNAPEGVQVAYLQRQGSVAQTLYLQGGTYELSFYAAQRQHNKLDEQELQILVDGVVRGTIKSTDMNKDYKLQKVKFDVTTGNHTITIRGTKTSDETALVDLVNIHTVVAASFNEEFIPWTPLSGFVKQLATATNGNGQVQVFGIGSDNALWYRTQNVNNDPNSFGSWVSLGGVVKQFTVGQNADGRLQVFAVGGDNAAYTNLEVNGAFTSAGWTSLGGVVKQLTVARNANDDLELFAIGGDNALYRKVQTDGTNFGAWTSLGGVVKQIVAAVNADKTVQVFGIGGDNALYTNKQSAPGGGGFNGWQSLGGFVSQIALGVNLDGTLQVFGIGGDNAAWTRKQNSGPSDQAASFTSWASLGGFVKQVAVGDYGDGSLLLLAIGGDNAAYGRRQTDPGGSDSAGFDPWVSYGGFVKQLVVDDNGITEAVHFFGIGGDNALYTRGQDLPDTLVLDVTHSTSGSTGQLLTEDALGGVVDEALRRWSATGLSDQQIAWLRGLDYRVDNLADSVLGLHTSSKIVLDADAAGRGWFIDPTLGLDEEFSASGTALPGEAAGVDLLTAVMHEMGHALGFDHADSGVMFEALATGTRWNPR